MLADAHFWVGTTERPTSAGTQVANEVGSHQKLPRYRDAYLVLTLPEGKKITDFTYFGVWCKQATADFGHVKIARDFVPPREVSLGPIPTYAHGTSADDVIVKDFKTLFIKNLKYDGAGPGSYQNTLHALSVSCLFHHATADSRKYEFWIQD